MVCWWWWSAPVCVVCAPGAGVVCVLPCLIFLHLHLPLFPRIAGSDRGRWHEQIICVPLHTTLYTLLAVLVHVHGMRGTQYTHSPHTTPRRSAPTHARRTTLHGYNYGALHSICYNQSTYLSAEGFRFMHSSPTDLLVLTLRFILLNSYDILDILLYLTLFDESTYIWY